jgi:hypothetical protein
MQLVASARDCEVLRGAHRAEERAEEAVRS